MLKGNFIEITKHLLTQIGMSGLLSLVLQNHKEEIPTLYGKMSQASWQRIPIEAEMR